MSDIDGLPILYSFRRCPYAMRARLALYFSQTPYILREVSLKNKPNELLDISPKATVPVLQLADSRIIDESLDIIDYVLEQHDPNELLAVSDIQQQNVKSLIKELHDDFIPLITRYKYFVRYPEHPQQHYLNQIEDGYFAILEQSLSKNKYLASDKVSVADIAILPLIRQFHMVDMEWFPASKFPMIYRWLTEFINSILFQDIVMQKHEPWVSGDKLVIVK